MRVKFLILASLLLSACSDEQAPSKPQASSENTPAVTYTASHAPVDDLKAVLATVRSKKVVEARVRTPGTVATLNITEGAYVSAGQVLGIVADPKIALRLRASEAQLVALESRLSTAKAELDRTSELLKRGVLPQARFDQAKTGFDVASNDLEAARSERAVIAKQAEEGQVLAPAAGRVLRVPVTEGSVVMAGESIATVAANEYLLRLEVPERHARFMKKGDALKVGRRGMADEAKPATEGRIVQIYPEIQGGRVIADAEVEGLGDYFVGERTLVWISAGSRQVILVPEELISTRFGLDYVRLASAAGPIDVVVQLGQRSPTARTPTLVEVLSGLQSGDRLVMP